MKDGGLNRGLFKTEKSEKREKREREEERESTRSGLSVAETETRSHS